MKVAGKQSKDRFLFVINKLDMRRKEDGKMEDTLARVKNYLKDKHINNPNIFPAAALPALDIRLKQRMGKDADSQVSKKAMRAIEDFNYNDGEVDLHFEKYASLPKSIEDSINSKLINAKKDNDSEMEALIHTGIISIEAAIRQYVQKYAKTAKIKNIADTFRGKLEEEKETENNKKSIAELANEDTENARNDLNKIKAQINYINEKTDSAKEAKNFKNTVDDAVVKINNESKEVVENIKQRFQSLIRQRIDHRRVELELDDVEHEVELLEKFAKKLEPYFEAKLNELITEGLVKTANVLLDEYKKKLSSLSEEISNANLTGLTIDPLKLMSGSITYNEFTTENLEKIKDVEDGKEYVQTRGWFESFAFWPKKEWVKKYKKVKYVNGSELAREFFRPVEYSFSDNGDRAIMYAEQQSKKIVNYYNDEFKRLDNVLKDKLSELESYATDKEKAEKRIEEADSRLKWLNKIKADVESILEI